MKTLNVHTRYLSEPIVDYAELLLRTFDAPLDRVYFTNSGSESNELALRIAGHMTGCSGVIVTDHSYHGNTISLAALTTGLTVSNRSATTSGLSTFLILTGKSRPGTPAMCRQPWPQSTPPLPHCRSGPRGRSAPY